MSDKQSEVIEAQSAFSSTLINDMETPTPEGSARKRIMSIEPHPGTDAVCAAKSALLSQALQDLGMGRYQWFLVLVTCIGWFLDSVCSIQLIYRLSSELLLTIKTYSSGSYLSNSSRRQRGQVLLFFRWPRSLPVHQPLHQARHWCSLKSWMSDRFGRKCIFTSTIVLMGMGGHAVVYRVMCRQLCHGILCGWECTNRCYFFFFCH